MANIENDKDSEDTPKMSQPATGSQPADRDVAGEGAPANRDRSEAGSDDETWPDWAKAERTGAVQPDDALEEAAERTAAEIEESIDEELERLGEADQEPEPQTDPEPEPEPAPAPQPKPAPKAAPAPKSKGSFFTPLVGGVLAAGIGYAAAQFIKPEGWPFPSAGRGAETQAELSAARQQIKALEARVEELAQAGATAAAPDVSPQLAEVEAQIAALAERVAGFDARFEELAKAPIAAAGGQAAEAAAAYEREISEMRKELAAQREENAKLAKSVASVADRAEAEVDAAMDRAAQVEARAALMRIDAALANGAPFDSALGQFGAVAVPEGLSRVASSGVKTLAELQTDFPAAARAALDAALEVEAEGGMGDRFNAFMRSQLGLRSLEPREGDDADAVLSRAEALLRQGDLRAALTELEALPEPARAALAGWTAAAQARADAVEGAQALEQSLNN